MTTCPKCNNTGWYAYDHNHSKVCEVCCTHTDGWWKLEEHYGESNGRDESLITGSSKSSLNAKYACKTGCGVVKAYEDLCEEQIVNVTVYRF
jgi:hypothetical protein